MPPILAKKTLERIAELMQRDQGAAYRGLLRKYLPLMEDAYREDEFPFRSHLGMSLIGRECAREVWYSWHWTRRPNFEGRVLRLFNRGHLEEGRFLALLEMIGCELWFVDEAGNQFRFKDHNDHFAGGIDGVARGIPDLPEEPVLLEFKTHSLKSFQELKDNRVRESKFEHYVQMNQYMGRAGLKWALYLAVNKNDDDIYGELVAFDQSNFDQFTTRALQIIDAKVAPPRINTSPSWFKCKFCDMAAVCHSNATPERNCRTCKHSQPVAGGDWMCFHPEMELTSEDFVRSKEAQLRGCDRYEENPTIRAK